MQTTTEWKKRIYDHSKKTPNHLVVVYENLIRRVNKLIKAGKVTNETTCTGFSRVKSPKGKYLQTSSRCDFENYNRENERFYISLSVSFYKF